MKIDIHWKLDANGIVTGLNLHDGCFYGIVAERAEKGSVVRLLVRSFLGESYVILLENVHRMNVMNFWGGDIILDVSLLPIEKTPPHMWKLLFRDRITEDEKIAEAITKERRKYFFSLESSYGADIYATCDGIQINEPKGNEPTSQP